MNELFFRQHPLRESLAKEVHARPFHTVASPVRGSFFAFTSSEDGEAADRRHLASLARHYGVNPPQTDARYFAASIGALRLRWERHTEFCTYLFLSEEPESREDPFTDPIHRQLEPDWLSAIPGELLVALHLAVEPPGRDTVALANLFGRNELVGSAVDDGRAQVWTDFRIRSDGFGRFLVVDNGETEIGLGRLLQRLVEIETYRMMALLAFPLAQETNLRIRRLSTNLEKITGQMNDPDDAPSDEKVLEELTRLAVAAEALAANTSYRFSATKAYWGLVQHRLSKLRETRTGGTQTLQEFLSRRLEPAMNTCHSAEERLTAFTQRLARAGQWLQTRVGIAVETQNSTLLSSLNRNVQVQIKLQEAVEGFSTVAISYYLLGLIGYVTKGIDAGLGFDVPVSPTILLAFAVPLVFLSVWTGVKRLQRQLLK